MTDRHDNHDEEEIDCLQAIGMLYEYLDGQIEDAHEKEKFEQHLAHCKHCFSRSQMEQELNKRLKSAPREEAPPEFKKRLRNLLDEF